MTLSLQFFLHAMFTVLLWTAFILSVAVKRTPLQRQSPLEVAGWNLSIAGWLMLAGGASYLLYQDGRLTMHVPPMLGIGLLALGSVVKSAAMLAGTSIGHPCRDCPFYIATQNRETQAKSADPPLEPIAPVAVLVPRAAVNSGGRERRVG